jgi:hypothetical protein
VAYLLAQHLLHYGMRAVCAEQTFKEMLQILAFVEVVGGKMILLIIKS